MAPLIPLLTPPASILIVEDEFLIANDLRHILEQAGYQVIGLAASAIRARALVAAQRPTIVLLDIFLDGEETGIELARWLGEQDIPFVFLSANLTSSILEAAKVTRPFGFLNKPFRDKDVLTTLEIARYRHAHNADTRLRQPLETTSTSAATIPRAAFNGIIGTSPALLTVFERISQVAPTNYTVLVQGETGTGKELVARAIHHASLRRAQALVTVNCAALPAQLIESELFGHERGSYTGATGQRIGKFEQAHGSTLFLDEIGELPLELQAKLLRALQEKEIERLGGKGPIAVDVRIIAATNRDLLLEVAAGRFRQDLYYRLHVFPILVPALRERPEDVLPLALHFLQLIGQQLGKPFTGITNSALQQLRHYAWPGNIRELEHVLERAAIMSPGTTLELAETLVPSFRPRDDQGPAIIAIKPMNEAMRETILAALAQAKNRIRGAGGAAELLDLKPTTLEARMKKLQISPVK